MRSLISFMLGLFGLFLLISSEVTAQVPILLVDSERVEGEAAAYKSFNLKTANIRDQILSLRQFFTSGGQFEQQLSELEKQKSLIGADAYEEQRQNLEQQFQAGRQNLQLLELTFDRLRQEAARQVELARQPVIRKIIEERGAQVILPKRLVLGSTSGIDVTTEYIELLNVEIPEVDLPDLTQASNRKKDENSDTKQNSGGIEEID